MVHLNKIKGVVCIATVLFTVGYGNTLITNPKTTTLESDFNIRYQYEMKALKSGAVHSDKSAGTIETLSDVVVTEVKHASTDGYVALHDNYSTRIDAYGVYVDDEYIGVVDDVSQIELLKLKVESSVIGEDYQELQLSHNITYTDVQIERDLINNEHVMDVLNGLENETLYYEVKPGDSISSVGEHYGRTLEDIYSYRWAWNGEFVDNLPENFKVGTIICIPTDKAYIRPIITKEETEYSEITYKTITLNDDTVPEGQINVMTEGKYGIKEVVSRNTYDNGVIIESEVLSEQNIAEPIDEVVVVGTKHIVEVATSGGGTGTYFYPITSSAAKISAYMGDSRGHKGLDIAAPRGTEIYAAASGVVSKINYSGWGGGYGKYVYVTNDDGNECMYAHMSYTALDLKEGDPVVEGQLLGYVGSTGDSTGNHLHFEVRTSEGVFKNPLNYVKP